ncbi:MAG: transporter associated domain-containing protein [Lysobacteraceae bacterium]
MDDEHDDDAPAAAIAAQDDGRFVLPALTPIGDFNERFGADLPDDEFDTLGGFVTAGIGHLPEPGERHRVGPYEFTVLEADQHRLRTLGVTVHAAD